jgi:heterodisulfide reductase subunit A
MAVAKAALIQPLPFLTIPVTPKASIIGGGVTGMIASLELANQGFECFLIERSDKLGGNARRLRHTLEEDDISKFLEELIQNVEQHQLIHVYKNAEIKEISGYVGNFKTRVFAEGKEDILEHGVIIVATGGREYHPSEYVAEVADTSATVADTSADISATERSEHEKILTQLELEEKLTEGSLKPGEVENVVMIQCVGSRTKERPYCSKVCCSQAVKNALKIKELNPFSNVYVLYKDLRTYSFKEEFYQKARDVGVTFLRYSDEREPEVAEVADTSATDEKIKITVFDPLLGEELIIMSDLLVLSVGILPEEGTEELAKMLKVPLNEDGFFLEAHVKLRPVEFASEGIFVAGLAHSPKPIEESISQALVAAGKAAITLSKGFLSVEPIVSTVDEEKCIGCGLCESLCAFGAIRVAEVADTSATKDGTNKAETIAASCKGCGLCAANCPQHAISMGHFRDEEITAQIRALGIRNAELRGQDG